MTDRIYQLLEEQSGPPTRTSAFNVLKELRTTETPVQDVVSYIEKSPTVSPAALLAFAQFASSMGIYETLSVALRRRIEAVVVDFMYGPEALSRTEPLGLDKL